VFRSNLLRLSSVAAIGACSGTAVLKVDRIRDFGDAGRDATSAPVAQDAADARIDVEPINVGTASACALAVDESNVYWASGTADSVGLMKLPSAGGNPVVLSQASRGVTSLAVDSLNLYFSEAASGGPGPNTSSSTVNKVPLSGGVTEPIGTVPLQASALAVDGPDLYLTTLWQSTFDPGDQVPRGTVVRFPIAGGTPSTLVTGLEDAVDIAVDATSVYWAQSFGAGCTWGCVMAVPRLGGAPTTIVSNATTTQQSIRAFAMDATTIYWTNQGAVSTVMGRALSGGTPTTVASDQREPYAIALDSSNVYWTTYGGTVMRASRGGGGATQLAEGQCGPCAIAVNDSSVYWISCGALMKLQKAR
jgi:hypothetical protein